MLKNETFPKGKPYGILLWELFYEINLYKLLSLYIKGKKYLLGNNRQQIEHNYNRNVW